MHQYHLPPPLFLPALLLMLSRCLTWAMQTSLWCFKLETAKAKNQRCCWFLSGGDIQFGDDNGASNRHQKL